MHKKTVIIIFVILLVFSIAYEFISKIKLHKQQNQLIFELMELIEKKDYDSFYERIDDQECIRIIPRYNRMFIKLNVSILNHDFKRTDELFEKMKKIYMRKNQKEELYLKGFGYYCMYDKSKAEYYYDLLKTLKLPIDKKEFVNWMYNIYIEKGNKYLDIILNELMKLPDANKKMSYMLLEQIYTNVHDTENAKKYHDLYYQTY